MTGLFDMKPTPESLMVKEKNRQHRKAKKGPDGDIVIFSDNEA